MFKTTLIIIIIIDFKQFSSLLFSCIDTARSYHFSVSFGKIVDDSCSCYQIINIIMIDLKILLLLSSILISNNYHNHYPAISTLLGVITSVSALEESLMVRVPVTKSSTLIMIDLKILLLLSLLLILNNYHNHVHHTSSS